VSFRKVTEDVAKDMDLRKKEEHFYRMLLKEGPADKAGIETGDVIIKFGGKDINKMRELTTNVANTDIGKKG
jgi:Trypsin-like serine proteases, typically periplasmic, contain C-terminal PDZ domain